MLCVCECVCIYSPLQMVSTLYRHLAYITLFVPSYDTRGRPLCCSYEKCLSYCVCSRLPVDNKQVNTK